MNTQGSNNEFMLIIRSDCEATAHAIDDAALGERATRALCRIASDTGMKMTLLVIPGDLEASPELYREMESEGHEIGLHVHPADLGSQEFLGVLGPDEQKDVIKRAADSFASVMGREPESICIGYNSANDYTYSIFAELGFTHGKISSPGRALPECASVWSGAPLGMHYAHPYNRLLLGWLDFVEIPQTVDLESRMWGGKHAQDLRVELVDAKNHWYTTAKSVERQMAEDTDVKYLHICTHNIFEFGKPDDFRRETLQKMIDQACRIVESRGGKLVGATMKQAADKYRRVFPIDKAGRTKLELDTRGR